MTTEQESKEIPKFIDPEEIKLSEIFDAQTEEILKELNLNVEALDSSHFSVVDYINEMFPTEQSLANIDDIMENIEVRVRELDEESRRTLRGQWKTEASGQVAVQEATGMIQDLFSKIREVQDRATHSENMVKEITRDIQQLDLAKRNLTTSITTLNNLTLIMSSVDRLKTLLKLTTDTEPRPTNPFDAGSSRRLPVTGDGSAAVTASELDIDYAEVDEHLSHASRVLAQLQNQFPDVPVVRELDQDMHLIHIELNQGRLQADMRHVLMSGKANANNMGLVDQLHAMCRVVEQLEPENRRALVKWFIDQQLSEYRVLFDETQTTAWLDKIDHRYSWLRSNLLNFDKRFSLFFPRSWLMTEKLIVEFCDYTRQALSSLMRQRGSELTDSIVIFAIKRTHVFEEILGKSFCVESLKKLIISQRQGSSEVSKPPTKSEPVVPGNPFIAEGDDTDKNTKDDTEEVEEDNPIEGLISSCFEAHLHLYIEDVDRVLNEQLTKNLMTDTTVNEAPGVDKEFQEVLGEFRKESMSGGDAAEDTAENSLNSATSLFLLYRKVLTQAPQLSRGQPLVDLSRVLAKYLREYNSRVLQAQLPGKAAQTSGAGTAASAWLAGAATSAGSTLANTGTAANQIFQTLLKDDQSIRLSKDETKRVCVVLVTACYCLKTVEELERRLKSKVRPRDLASQIEFSAESEALACTRAQCVQLLAADLEAGCEPALVAMQRTSWTAIVAVGDQSAFVSAIQARLCEAVPTLRSQLHTVRAFFTQLCIQFVNGFVQRFLAALFKCRVPSTVAAEQLLLDTHSLKTVLVKLPVLGSKTPREPPRSFTNVVLRGMGHAEKVIKAVMAPCGRPADFLESLLHLLPDCDHTELQRILEMRGLRRPEQAAILEQFRSTKVSRNKVSGSPGIDNTATTATGSSSGEVSNSSNKMNQLEKLIKIIK